MRQSMAFKEAKKQNPTQKPFLARRVKKEILLIGCDKFSSEGPPSALSSFLSLLYTLYSFLNAKEFSAVYFNLTSNESDDNYCRRLKGRMRGAVWKIVFGRPKDPRRVRAMGCTGGVRICRRSWNLFGQISLLQITFLRA